MRATVWIVLEAFDAGWNRIFVVTFEINAAIALLMTTTTMARGDATIIIAPTILVLLFK